MAYYTNIRYGKLRMVARFKTVREDIRVRDRCIVRTDRGKEIGEVLSPLEPLPETLPPESLWDVIRPAGPDDLRNAELMETERVPHATRTAKTEIGRLKLQMKLTDVDCVLGGERIIFYFTSQSRVDFRELVRALAREYRTRIELKQVGARDEARLIGDAGHCGLTLCCRSHLKELGGISMDMAKVQKHTADPSKITGRCGKLLCCLRYEYTAYVEARQLLPPRGRMIESAKGERGVIREQNLLLREVTIEKENGDRVIVKADEIKGAQPAVAGCDGCATPAAGESPKVETKVAEKISKDTVVAPAVRSDGPQPPKPPEPAKAGPKLGEAGFWVRVGRVSEFPPGGGRTVGLGPVVKVAVFNVDGVFHALDNRCPHQGGPLGRGKLEGTVVACPWHQWKFDVTSGQCLSVSGSHATKLEAAALGDEIFVRI